MPQRTTPTDRDFIRAAGLTAGSARELPDLPGSGRDGVGRRDHVKGPRVSGLAWGTEGRRRWVSNDPSPIVRAVQALVQRLRIGVVTLRTHA